jgi:ATP-binding cassette subfamily C protein LapB
LLDEPTAALDQNLENTLVTRIGKWVGARTCIVATHRPQILSEMTHVAVLQQGRIILEGKRDETLKKLMKPPEPKLASKS